jgi:hypothetical protein
VNVVVLQNIKFQRIFDEKKLPVCQMNTTKAYIFLCDLIVNEPDRGNKKSLTSPGFL